MASFMQWIFGEGRDKSIDENPPAVVNKGEETFLCHFRGLILQYLVTVLHHLDTCSVDIIILEQFFKMFQFSFSDKQSNC